MIVVNAACEAWCRVTLIISDGQCAGLYLAAVQAGYSPKNLAGYCRLPVSLEQG